MNTPMHSAVLVVAGSMLAAIAGAAHAQVPQRDFKNAADKQAAFVAQATAQALDQDIAILQRLDVPFPKSVSFVDTPAGDVMKAIRSSVKATIEFDSRALGDSGGWEATRLSCEPATVRQALEAVVRAISPEYEQYAIDVAAGLIVVTDEAGQRTLKTTAQYPLETTIARLGAKDGDGLVERTRNELEDFLMLTRHDAWVENGGDIARVTWTGPVATVEATPAMHHDIRRRLARLADALPSQNLVWAVTVAEIPAGADATAVDAAVAAREGLDKLAAQGGAKIVSAPRLLAPSNESAEIKIGSDASELTVRIEPAGTRTGRVFVVRVSERNGASTREFSIRAVPGVRAATLVGGAGGMLLIDVLGTPDSTTPTVPAAAPAAVPAGVPAK